jgi:hypothetical protein
MIHFSNPYPCICFSVSEVATVQQVSRPQAFLPGAFKPSGQPTIMPLITYTAGTELWKPMNHYFAWALCIAVLISGWSSPWSTNRRSIIICNLIKIIVATMNHTDTLNIWSASSQHKTVHMTERENKHVTVVKNIICSLLIWWHDICYGKNILYCIYLCVCVCVRERETLYCNYLSALRTAYEQI